MIVLEWAILTMEVQLSKYLKQYVGKLALNTYLAVCLADMIMDNMANTNTVIFISNCSLYMLNLRTYSTQDTQFHRRTLWAAVIPCVTDDT